MSILDKINSFLNENIDMKNRKADSLGLIHIAYNYYKDKSGQKYEWSDDKNEFEKINKEDKTDIYYPTYNKVVKAAELYAIRKGYEIDDDDMFDQVSSRKPNKGQTVRYTVGLKKDGVESKKKLSFQIYKRDQGSETYELNVYVAN